MSEKLKDNNDSFSCKRILPYPQKVNPLKDAIKNNTEMSNSIIFYKKECLSTNKEIASILMNDYPSFRKAIIGDHKNAGKIFHIAIDLLVKELVDKDTIKLAHSGSLSQYQKNNPRAEHLVLMRERSRSKEGIFKWNDEHKKVLVELCLKYRRGRQISKNAVIGIFQQLYPNATFEMVDKMITRWGISDKSPRSKHPEYEDFLERCMISLIEDKDSPYRLRGRGKNKVNGKLIEQEFCQKFPKAQFTSKSIKEKCFKIRKILGIDVSKIV